MADAKAALEEAGEDADKAALQAAVATKQAVSRGAAKHSVLVPICAFFSVNIGSAVCTYTQADTLGVPCLLSARMPSSCISCLLPARTSRCLGMPYNTTSTYASYFIYRETLYADD